MTDNEDKQLDADSQPNPRRASGASLRQEGRVADVQDRRRRMRQFAAMCKPTEAERAAQFSQLSGLREISHAWRRSNERPPVVGVLSSGEYAAVCMASGHSGELDDAFMAFVMLDGWLQRWVLEERGLAHFVDTRIGADVP